MNEQKNISKVRTRIAPSPTGDDIHIGNLYTALINFAVAQKNKGQFIIRIEDTDRTRLREGAEEKILASIKSFGLLYAEGPDIGGPFAPYRQSERLSLYKEYADQLIGQGDAYYCFCTKERLDSLRESQIKDKRTPKYDKHCFHNVHNAKERITNGEQYVIRLNVKPDQTVTFNDLIRGSITINTNDIDDQVLLKSDGYPTYHLGVVVDDHLMEISHIIRAEEWISSTPKHVLLYLAFGWDLPVFAHVPILRNPDKSKLSKRKNPVWASWYLEEGFLSEAVLNYLALLGWSHPDEKEIFSLNEFIETFRLEDVNAVGPVFDIVKLTWMNQQYIQSTSNDQLRNYLLKFYENDSSVKSLLLDVERSNKILDLAKTRMKTLKDFRSLIAYFFEPVNDELFHDEHYNVAPVIQKSLQNLSEDQWTKEAIFEAMKSIMSENRAAKMPLFYVLFTSNKQGLPLPDTLEILGRRKTLERLSQIVK